MMAVRAGVAVMLVPLALGCSGGPLGGTPSGAVARDPDPVLVQGRFVPYHPGVTTITYDPALVPSGSEVTVAHMPADRPVKVELRVQGLLSNRKYGAHVHTKRCGAKPDDAGPHYQHVKDPVKPSTDPKYANSRNEVWLDFTTDAKGEASSLSKQDWKFDNGRRPQSIVIHKEHTHTDAGHAGTAGARLACVDVDF